VRVFAFGMPVARAETGEKQYADVRDNERRARKRGFQAGNDSVPQGSWDASVCAFDTLPDGFLEARRQRGLGFATVEQFAEAFVFSGWIVFFHTPNPGGGARRRGL